MIAHNAWTSIMAFARAMRDELVADGTIAETAKVIDFEARANIQELDAVDLIGPVSFSFEEVSSGMCEVAFSIAVSTFEDKNLFRHRKIMARIFEALRPERTLTFYDAETSAPTSWMVVRDGTMLAPVTNAQVRAFQFIQAEALLDPLASPSAG